MHVLNTDSYSGAENVVISIMLALKEKFDFCYVSKDGSIRDVLEKNNILFLPFRQIRITELKRIQRYFCPDLIHAHDFRASIICSVTHGNIPLLSHLHNNPPWMKTFCPFSLLYLVSSTAYQSILLVSPAVLQEYIFRRLIERKSQIISNPVNINQILDKTKTRKDSNIISYDLLFIGRLVKQKNPLRFIRIISDLIKKGINVQCAMLGDGEMKEECKLLIHHLHLENNITMTGFVDNPYFYLKHAKLLCITSSWEGYGLVAIEALALRIPVVTTSAGGLVTIVEDSCGKICSQNNEFVEEITKLIQDEEYWRQKSQHAWYRAKQLDNMAQYIKRLEDIYPKWVTGSALK